MSDDYLHLPGDLWVLTPDNTFDKRSQFVFITMVEDFCYAGQLGQIVEYMWIFSDSSRPSVFIEGSGEMPHDFKRTGWQRIERG